VKCNECEWFIDGICNKMQKMELSYMDNPVCLMKVQIMILRDIQEELRILNEAEEDDDDILENEGY